MIDKASQKICPMLTLQEICIQLGLNPGDAAVVLVLLLTLPLALMYRLLPIPGFVQVIVNLVIGLYGTRLIWGNDALAVIFIIALICYVLVFLQRVGVPPSIPCIISTFVLWYFQAQHMFSDYLSWRVDIATPLMLLVARVSTFSYDVYDGKTGQVANPYSIKTIPNVLYFMSYIFSVFTLVGGPAILYRQYMDPIDKPDMSFRPALKAILYFSIAVCGLILSGRIPQLSTNYWFTADFANLCLFTKLIVLHLGTFVGRCKYYAAWSFAEFSLVLAGYNSESACNADIFQLETAWNMPSALGQWNKSISYWLKTYVFKRGPFTSRTMNMALTRFVSAFWHGFYPGYYLTFMFLLLGDKAEAACKATISPILAAKLPSKVYNLLAIIGTHFAITYYTLPFAVLSFDRSIQIWKSIGFIGHIVHIVAIFGLPMVFSKVNNTKSD